MKKYELVNVYLSLLKVENDSVDNTVSAIAEKVEYGEQRTELILDELEHMGLVQKNKKCWKPLLFNHRDD